MPPSPHVLVTPSQLGSMLQAARKARGMTQSALADRIGLSQSRISHLEQNPHDLSVGQLLAWCSALGLELAVGTHGGRASSGVQADW
ncbi:helix-turn-helix domain-containing protein [Rhodanobacter geophilus]|uniref:Helix-turn-helix domain-containing protein n=1 Tax=Rhodanobacter geophilus TaxID=3162488 RepID=A0ABV3QVD0_9GAMM